MINPVDMEKYMEIKGPEYEQRGFYLSYDIYYL